MSRLWVFCMFICSSLFAAEDISGFWKSYNDEGRPQCIFGVYEYKGTYYGKIIGTYNEEGVMTDTIYKPVSTADGVVGNPHTCGLDIVYNLEDEGERFSGKIIDPSRGKIYNCEMWRRGAYLILRGKLFIFGKNITWYPADKSDFPKGFKIPNLKKLTPNVPEVY